MRSGKSIGKTARNRKDWGYRSAEKKSSQPEKKVKLSLVIAVILSRWGSEPANEEQASSNAELVSINQAI